MNMEVVFLNTEAQIKESNIKNIEIKLGFSLPEEYRMHLLKHNGGKCKPNIFSFNENGIISKSSIAWFLAIYEGKYDNLSRYIDIFKLDQKRLPKYFVPIAHDDGGNLICISCSNQDYGHIYFWDHEKEGDDDDYFGNVYFIAGSLFDFFNSLSDNG